MILSKVKKATRLFTRRERWQFVTIFIAILFMSLFQSLGVLSVLPFVNLVMQPEIVKENRWLLSVYNTLGFTEVKQFIIFAGFAMLLVIIIGNAVSALATWLKLRFVWRNNHVLSRRLLQKYLSQPYVYFLTRHSADLSKNILNEVNFLTMQFILPLITLIARCVMVFFILAMLILVDPVITVGAAILLGGLYAIIYLYFQPKLKSGGKKRLQANSERFKSASEALSGIKHIKVNNKEKYFLERFSVHSLKNANLQAWSAIVIQVPRYLLETFAFGGVIVLVLFLLHSGQEAHHIIPLVSFYAFAGYRLMPALQEIFNAFASIQFLIPTLDKIYDDMTEEVTESGLGCFEQPAAPVPFKDKLELHRLSFIYPETGEPVIKDINLVIQKNASVAFVGPTGSGKTTLLDIILCLLMPQEGYLSVDGVKIDRDNYRNWQQNLGYVPQHIYLSDDTITRNIAFGVPDEEIDMEMVKSAARIANLEQFIENELPRCYDTTIGEQGIRLSGGQRQRIGIARALYKDPGILVLDEATSSLDGVTEEAFLEAIENVAHTKTLIIVAHRLTTVKNCDTIYLVNRGSVTASGTFEELIKTNDQFKAMAKLNIKEDDG